jgi:hypothetical protein
MSRHKNLKYIVDEALEDYGDDYGDYGEEIQHHEYWEDGYAVDDVSDFVEFQNVNNKS